MEEQHPFYGRPHIEGIATKNKFRIGDAVAHPAREQKGLVVHVQHDWVKFEVIGQKGPDGKSILRRFNYRKIALIATADQLAQGFAKYQKAREEAAKRAKNPIYRFTRWAGALIAPKATRSPQPV